MRYILVLFLISMFVELSSQTTDNLKWYTIEEAQELCKIQPRKILIDMYTDWCGWCKKMESETFQNPVIANFINNNFYAVKFNAETRDTISFKGKKYYNNQTGRRPSHDLAIELLGGRMSYPTVLYLDENFDILSPVPGFMTVKDIEPILFFFGRSIYKSTSFEDFKTAFDEAAKKSGSKRIIQWNSLNDINDYQNKTKRKSLIFLTADWCVECKIMQLTTMENPFILEYFKKDYNAYELNITSTDTIVFKEEKFFNDKSEHPYHNLAVLLLNGQMNVPAIVFMNEDNELLSVVPGYFSDRNFEPVLEFFKTEAYRNGSWEDFVQGFKPKIK